MTRRELAERVRDMTGGQRTVAEMQQHVDSMIDCMAEALTAGRIIEFRDFGVFETVERKARLGRNPRRPEEVVSIPPRTVITFRASPKLAAKLKPPRKAALTAGRSMRSAGKGAK